MYKVVYSKEATRTLTSIQRKLAESLQSRIEVIAADPYARNNNVTKLQGRDGYRLRVGDWRVIYEIDDGVMIIHVIRIAVRGDVYKG